MPSEALHEPLDRISQATADNHRAIQSLREELEAVDWYQQRIDVTPDPELREILEHNRDEEKEHAAMLVEWLRRRDKAFDQALRSYLNTEGSLVELERRVEGKALEGKTLEGEGEAAHAGPEAPRFSIGGLRGAG